MKVKIDTKEKFHVITIEEPALSANMTENIKETLLSFLNKSVKNVILNLESVQEIDESVANTLVSTQQTFYDRSTSTEISSRFNPFES